VSTVAVELARDTVGNLANRSVVVIGAGETSERTAEALAAQGVTTIFIANRHADRARALADRFGGQVGSLDALPDRLMEADIVVASTASPHSLIGPEEIGLVMQARGGRPLMLIDIAVPRDIEPECGEIEGVSLYDIDDLQAVVARNREVRASERAGAEAVVEEEIQRFAQWMGQLDVVPTIAALREHGAGIVDQVLAENSGRWESASPRDLARIEAVARAVMQRLLHEPTLRLKGVDGEPGGDVLGRVDRDVDVAAQERGVDLADPALLVAVGAVAVAGGGDRHDLGAERVGDLAGLRERERAAAGSEPHARRLSGRTSACGASAAGSSAGAEPSSRPNSSRRSCWRPWPPASPSTPLRRSVGSCSSRCITARATRWATWRTAASS